MNKFEISSNALVMVGGQPITDFDGGSTESVIASRFWTTTFENWMSLHDWRFPMRQAQLSRLLEAPDANWDAAYDLPGDLITLLQVTVNDTPIPYDRFERRVYCNASETQEVYADYIYAIGEASWPPYFTALIELALAEKFAFPLGGKGDLAKELNGLVEKQFARAKTRDSQQQTTRRIEHKGRGSILERRRS